jgi:hypothetical protein
MNVQGYAPAGWPPLPERILEAAVQGLTANMTVDPKQPQVIASMAVAITEAVMKQVTGQESKLVWHGAGLNV